jgi:hypothetical protein
MWGLPAAAALAALAPAAAPAAAPDGAAEAGPLFNSFCLAPAIEGLDPEAGLRGPDWQEVKMGFQTFAKKPQWLLSHRTWKRVGTAQPVYISLVRYSGKAARSACMLHTVAGTQPDESLTYLIRRGFQSVMPRGVARGVVIPSERRAGPSFLLAAKTQAGRRLNVELMSVVPIEFAELDRPVLWRIEF